MPQTCRNTQARKARIQRLLSSPPALSPALQSTSDVVSPLIDPAYTPVGHASQSGGCHAVSQSLSSPASLRMTPCGGAKPQVKLDLKSRRGVTTPNYPPTPISPPLAAVREVLQGSDSLYEDPETSTIFSNTSTNDNGLPEGFAWKRPSELVACPVFVAGERPCIGFQLGDLNMDRFYTASLAALASHQSLFTRVVNSGQGFTAEHEYVGAFTFTFFLAGAWVHLTIDDRLPTVNGRLFSLMSRNENEFWPALLEKALARLAGSYEELVSWSVADTAAVLGAVTETFLVRGGGAGPGLPQEVVRQRLLEAASLQSLCAAAVLGGPEDSSELQDRYLPPTGKWFVLANIQEDGLSVKSVLEDSPPQRVDWNTFIENFQHVMVCQLSHEPGLETGWYMHGQVGLWGACNSGGSPLFNTFIFNPQFHVSVGEGGEDVTLVVALDQLSSLPLLTLPNRLEKHSIGYLIYPNNCPGQMLGAAELVKGWIGDSGPYRCEKQIVGRFSVPPGTYTILPTTYYQNRMAEFAIRILTPPCSAHRLTVAPLSLDTMEHT